MSDIKLTYFNARGRAETTRLILAHAGIKQTMSIRHLTVTRSEIHGPEAHL